MEGVTGVNVPMVIKAFGARTLALKELAEHVGEAGRQGIVAARGVLEQK